MTGPLDPGASPAVAGHVSPGDAGSAADALAVISLCAGFINNADTKSGLLGAAETVAVGALASEGHELLGSSWVTGPRDVTAALVVFGAVACLLFCGFYLTRSLLPRSDTQTFSRFSWPDLAQVELDVLLGLDDREARTEAWIEAQTLARIVRAKYRHFALAVRWFSVSLPLIFVGALLVT
jgi:hypothetical protein